MSDDSFIREVNQELRQDQAKALWRRYGPIAIAAAVLIILLTCAYVGFRYWNEVRANRSGDAYTQALALASDGKTDEALAALKELEQSGYGAYPVLARMRSATLAAQSGDAAGAVSTFDAVAADGSVPMSIRDMARLRAAFLLVDHGSYADVSSRVETLTADTNPLRHSAREALGLAAWKEGRATDALALFDQITDDQTAPANTRQRATLMAELIRGSGAAS
ncbi:tetratricopeptide repeat protein [Aquamicrobium sp. LC103]|uniref:tetratricopeptide repeat protein n=1 Tax=Aquamicrobium sp. LC103 TaxID=1120658 RepID=UPI00063EB064|nr:tetratricopeptide repeat protein [Aquamicrobium sp. LC103]TKT81092.1 tetratricopeptide repeat protein [Aquamicrobium sp. LC103]